MKQYDWAAMTERFSRTEARLQAMEAKLGKLSVLLEAIYGAPIQDAIDPRPAGAPSWLELARLQQQATTILPPPMPKRSFLASISDAVLGRGKVA
jgi:hypothetical protein